MFVNKKTKETFRDAGGNTCKTTLNLVKFHAEE